MADDLDLPFLASNRGLPSQSLSTLLVKLLTHRCTIAFALASNWQSWLLAFNGSSDCPARVACATRHRQSFALSSQSAFLWHYPRAHALRSFSGDLSLDARTFLTLLLKRDYPTTSFDILTQKLITLFSALFVCLLATSC